MHAHTRARSAYRYAHHERKIILLSWFRALSRRNIKIIPEYNPSGNFVIIVTSSISLLERREIRKCTRRIILMTFVNSGTQTYPRQIFSLFTEDFFFLPNNQSMVVNSFVTYMEKTNFSKLSLLSELYGHCVYHSLRLR